MLFRKISYTIALQFTAFVFLLFLVNGAIFLTADFNNARNQVRDRLLRSSRFVVQVMQTDMEDFPSALPPPLEERVRVVNETGAVLYSGRMFTGIPFSGARQFSNVSIQNDDYTILTLPIVRDGRGIGFVQVADVEREQLGDLPLRSMLYILVSVAISALTFIVGLFFARRSLRPAEQMVERLEQFTQDASHELRTPIAAVNSSLDLALKNKKYREGIESAKEDLKQVMSLAERLLELARLDRFALSSAMVDLSALTEQSIDRHRPLAAEKQITIEKQVAADVSLTGDEALLRQVLGNLLTNAVKFTPNGGTIRVKLTKSMLSVEDTGIGIPTASLPHLFDRFFQADPSRSRGGFGLGLALVKRICDLHGWTIDVKSEEGKGTTIALKFSSHR